MKNLAAAITCSLMLISPLGLMAQTAYGNHLIVSAFERQLCPTNATAPTNGLEIKGNGMGSRLIAETAKSNSGNDSTAYTYNGGRGGDYEDKSSIFPIKYDIATTYSTEEGSSTYKPSTRKLQEFNTLDQIVAVTGQEWNGLSWVNTDRILYSYNSKGLNETTISQIFTVGSATWSNVYKIGFTYNEQDQVILARYDAWNAINNMYEPKELNLYTYEPRSLTYAIQLYDPADGLYKNNSRYIYYFNNGMAQTGELHQTYKDNAWQNSDSTIIVSNPRTGTSENTFYSWNKDTWGRYGHYIIHYNDAGRQIASTDEQLNQFTNEYAGVTREALTYNAFNQRTTLFTYNLPSGKLDSKSRYYYGNYTKQTTLAQSEGTQLYLYPTPAVKSINISMTLAEPQRISCAIYDLSGKALQSWQNDVGMSYNKEVSVAELPSGTYWLKVNTSGNDRMSKSFTVAH